jgi:rhodanese-related sulfurtransferase
MPTSIKEMLSQAEAAVPRLSPAEVQNMMKNGNVVVLDVRDPPEVATSGKVKGALAISRGLLEFKADPASPAHHPALNPETPVILYCASGGRSALGGKTLKDLGFKTVYNAGGFKDLAEGGVETEKV